MSTMIPRTFVVPLDGSELARHAVDAVLPLARRLGANLVLVTTVWDGDTAAAQSHLDTVAGAIVDVPVETVIVRDRPAAEAIDLIADAAPDRMICMTTHGRGRFQRAAVGSVAEAVIRGTTRPLLLVGPHAVGTWSDPPGQLVVCVDGSPAAAATIAPALAWASALGCEVTLSYIAHPLDLDDGLRSDEIVAPLEKEVREAGIPAHVRIERRSYVAGALLDVADEPPATLLIMATSGRTGFARLALGSVTMAVVHGAGCPVLAIPPHFDAASEG
jgi:nucleotide-binding universal stress UspA family protein